MSNRKRINISVDPLTYEALRRLQEAYGFNSLCELVVSLAHLLLDRVSEGARGRYDIPEDDEAYIAKMFDDFGHSQRTPDGNAPVRRHSKRIK